MRIALLDDDPAQLVQLLTVLKMPIVRDDHISCVTFSQGEALRRALRRETFDILVVDWNVPDLDGTALVNWLRRERNDSTPVIMLSGRASEKDVAAALKIGADDYIVKPFRPLELRARIERLVARGRSLSAPASAVTAFGNWVFDGLNNVVIRKPASTESADELRAQLTEREFSLGFILFQNLGRVVSRNYLLEKSGYEPDDSPTRTLDSHIYRLRKKLGLDRAESTLRLKTIYGQGYRLQEGDDGGQAL